MKFKNIVITAFTISFVFSLQNLFAQWNIPETAKNQEAPFEISAETVLKGKEIYYKECNSCHGDPGKNNVVPLDPVPTDLGSQDFLSSRNDGEIFYQITTGMGTMPTFKQNLNDEQRWQVVHYIRSHSDEITVDLSSQKQELDLSVELADAEHKINAIVKGENKEGALAPVSGVDVIFYVKRYFGDLPIGEASTNANGYAAVEFPADLPGADTLGTAEIIVKFKNPDMFGEAEVRKTVTWAKPFHFKNPLDENHIWAPRANTPRWLLFSYLGVVGIVGLTILWVIGQLIRIRKYGKWH